MIIPFNSIPVDTLQNLIEEFVTREGTDYGDYQQTLEDKVNSVRQRLSSGEVVILFIESTQSVNIVDRQSLN
ncbi:MAG: YheU family protein [Oceanospirillaceae bacterium]|nr:YheU family protein [Oceanospirillaceae bacterium]